MTFRGRDEHSTVWHEADGLKPLSGQEELVEAFLMKPAKILRS